MLADFELSYSQYVLSMDEQTSFSDVSRILHDAVIRGNIGPLNTSIRGFQFKQVANPDSNNSADWTTLYLCVGLVCSVVLLVCVSVFVICKIHRHRKREQAQRLLPSMNNAGNINLTMLTNPVFDHSEDDQRRQHGSFTEDNTYAEFGEAILPYEVTYSTKHNVKDCNLVRDAARKNSESSFTSTLQSSLTRKNVDDNVHKPDLSQDYITPVVSKNELGQIEDVDKDNKKLLPDLTKSTQKTRQTPKCDPDDYLEPVPVKPGQGQSKLDLKGQGQECVGGQGHEMGKNSGYVNVDGVKDKESEHKSLKVQSNLPYIDMENTSKHNQSSEIRFVNEKESTNVSSSITEPNQSPIDRLAYMIHKPIRKEEDATYLEPSNQNSPPEYLDICLPRPSEMPPPDMSKRKLPPLPPPSVRF